MNRLLSCTNLAFGALEIQLLKASAPGVSAGFSRGTFRQPGEPWKNELVKQMPTVCNHVYFSGLSAYLDRYTVLIL